MSIRNLIAAVAVAAALPTTFAQSGPASLRGEAWYPAVSPAQVRQDVTAYAGAGPAMPALDFVGGEVGDVPHQHQYMAQNELKLRAMGHRGMGMSSRVGVQSPQEIKQYNGAGG